MAESSAQTTATFLRTTTLKSGTTLKSSTALKSSTLLTFTSAIHKAASGSRFLRIICTLGIVGICPLISVLPGALLIPLIHHRGIFFAVVDVDLITAGIHVIRLVVGRVAINRNTVGHAMVVLIVVVHRV